MYSLSNQCDFQPAFFFFVLMSIIKCSKQLHFSQCTKNDKRKIASVHCRCSELETLFWLLFRCQGQKCGQFDGDMVINLMPTDFDSTARASGMWRQLGLGRARPWEGTKPFATPLWAWQMREKFEHLLGAVAYLGAYELCYAICKGAELPWTGAMYIVYSDSQSRTATNQATIIQIMNALEPQSQLVIEPRLVMQRVS